jgi:hypothetical protein
VRGVPWFGCGGRLNTAFDAWSGCLPSAASGSRIERPHRQSQAVMFGTGSAEFEWGAFMRTRASGQLAVRELARRESGIVAGRASHHVDLAEG